MKNLLYPALTVLLSSAPLAPAATLLSAWEFNAGDVSGSNVAASGGSAANTTGVLQADASAAGGVLTLDGSGDYLQFGNDVTDLRNLGAMTVAAWVQTGSAGTDLRRIVEHEDNFYGPWADSGAFKFTIHGTPGGDPDSRAKSTTAPAVGVWQHVLVTYQSGQPANIYIDGVLEGTSAKNQVAMPNNVHTLQIGARRSGSGAASNFWDGLIDDVGIWDEPLSLQEIELLAGVGNGGYTGRTTPTLLNAPSGLQLTITPNATTPGNYDFEWDSQEGKLYDLVSDTDLSIPRADWLVYMAHADIESDAPSNTLVNVPGDGTERYFAVREKDPPPPPALLEEDFEEVTGPNPPADWARADSGAGTAWEVGEPSGSETGPDAAANGMQCAGTNIGGDYTATAEASLVTKAFTVPGDGATLSFSQYIDTDTDGTKTEVGSIRLLLAGDNSVLAGGDVAIELEGATLAWSSESIPLPDVADGLSVKLEFRFVSNALNEYAGFYIDDVKVTAD